MGQILRALRIERILLDLVDYGTTVDDILNLSVTFQEATWGQVGNRSRAMCFVAKQDGQR